MPSHTHIGGQALIEGVMVLSPHKYAMSVRKPNNSIKTKVVRLKKNTPAWHKWPVVRGCINLVKMMTLGMKAMMWSANETTDKKEEKLSSKELTLTVVFSIFLAIAIFKGVPYTVTSLAGVQEEETPIIFNIVDGLLRIALFIGYILAISFMSDIKRLFMYHGAEHMAIHCYEKKLKLTVQNVKKFSPIHPRCGTAFILIVLIVAIFVFSLIPPLIKFLIPGFTEWSGWVKKPFLFLVRVLFLPLVAGISYEVLKASDKKPDNVLLKLFSLPGLWMQRITTSKPSNDQIEVAIASVKAVAK